MKQLVALFVAFAAASALTPAFADEPRQITVQGNCLKSVQPDRGSVDFYSESINMDSQKAVAAATKAYENARDAVKKLNLKNLELSTLENSLNEERPWENNKSVFKGYRSRIGLRVYTSDIARLSEVTGAVAKQGIKNFGSFQTDMSPQKLKEEQESCLEIAIQNAKSKADKMAKAAGAKVGKVLALHEGASSGGQPPPRMYMMKNEMMGGAADTAATIDTKAESLSMSVTASYYLE